MDELLRTSKWSLLVMLILSRFCLSQCDMDMAMLCKTPLCECSTTVTGNSTVVVALLCRGVGLTEVPSNLGDYPMLEEM